MVTKDILCKRVLCLNSLCKLYVRSHLLVDTSTLYFVFTVHHSLFSLLCLIFFGDYFIVLLPCVDAGDNNRARVKHFLLRYRMECAFLLSEDNAM